MKPLMNIMGRAPYNNDAKEIKIPLQGRNLIITGQNGSGKTSFLKKLDETISWHLSKDAQQNKDNLLTLDYYQNEILKHRKGSYNYSQAEKNIEFYQNKIDRINELFELDIKNELEVFFSYEKNLFIHRSFDAMRTSKISPVTSSTSIEYEKVTALQNKLNNLGTKLEQHLVNIRVQKAFAFEKIDSTQLDKLNKWFIKFDNHLKFLFEDESAELNFDEPNLKYKIKIGSKIFDFQSLSSGYQAIFDIFSDLLVRTEFFEISPEELTGIVLIDEIDAHLHISLQKKIMPFFTNLFPLIQFIVSTHSPFVITSSNESSLVYDISNGEIYEDDLSSYSHEAIVKELFHVSPVSINLTTLTDSINELLIKDSQNIEDLKELNRILIKLEPHKNKLNSESRSLYMQALNLLVDNDALGDLSV